MCSSGCVGKSLGSQVIGWCQSSPGYNRHTKLATQGKCKQQDMDEGEKGEERQKSERAKQSG